VIMEGVKSPYICREDGYKSRTLLRFDPETRNKGQTDMRRNNLVFIMTEEVWVSNRMKQTEYMHLFPTQNKELSTWSPIARIGGRDVR
jgi:hypothetical protein